MMPCRGEKIYSFFFGVCRGERILCMSHSGYGKESTYKAKKINKMIRTVTFSSNRFLYSFNSQEISPPKQLPEWEQEKGKKDGTLIRMIIITDQENISRINPLMSHEKIKHVHNFLIGSKIDDRRKVYKLFPLCYHCLISLFFSSTSSPFIYGYLKLPPYKQTCLHYAAFVFISVIIIQEVILLLKESFHYMYIYGMGNSSREH